MKDENQSANEYYSQYHGTENYYRLNDFLLTDGVFEIAGEEGCFWFLQEITLNQKHPYGPRISNMDTKKVM